MGLVYLVEQEQPVRRQVAVKIIKLGMDTNQVIARFESERQALVMMNHPYRQVLDAGLHPTGTTLLLNGVDVEGTPITEYCDKQCLSTKQRLELFVDVCHAIQHAHQKGIIHRDVKPSNVLVEKRVDHQAIPKVIDFGVAKAINSCLMIPYIPSTACSLVPRPDQPWSRQNWQTGNSHTRTDVYSLGVLLYEFAGQGALPFEARTLRKAGFRRNAANDQ